MKKVVSVAQDVDGGMVHKIADLPAFWVELLQARVFLQARCSPDLIDAAQQIFLLNLAELNYSRIGSKAPAHGRCHSIEVRKVGQAETRLKSMSAPAIDIVAFLFIENGKDLIVSFAVMVPDDPTEIESLTLLRTPLYEPLLEEWERGVSVSFERYGDEEDMLEEVEWDEPGAMIRLKTRRRSYQLDLRTVDRNDRATMRKMLKKMNYDRKVQMSGV